ncbi:MAG: sigma 54-interacting transcriptional regulator [Candidatus Hydrogenedentes bacterium]|nr:sigma 54-interacting transcriptional regulator [Candidatus Hydrogenedentota bacterium]
MTVGVVTSDNALLAQIQKCAGECGHRVRAFTDLPSALADAEVRLVFAEVTSYALPDFVQALRSISGGHQLTPVVVLLPPGEVTVMYRMRDAGAADCLFAPVVDEEIRAELEAFLTPSDEFAGIDRERYLEIRRDTLVGESYLFKKCLEEIKRAARCDLNVFLVGETGTGKEMAARAIYRLGHRSGNMFMAVNCPSINSEVFPTELFGSKTGAFTGAQNRVGRFQAVGAGILFLDEIAEINLSSQTSLLRAIEQRVFQRLGDNKDIRFKGRLICATNKNLNELVEKGAFRLDLLNRINQLRIVLPTLCERREDIPILVRHFLQKKCAERGCEMEISPSTMKTLVERDEYPGNVRELESIIQAAMIAASPGRVILPHHLPKKEIAATPQGVKPSGTVITIPSDLSYARARDHASREIDKLFLPMLKKKHGDDVNAAKEAGIDRSTFSTRLKQVSPDPGESAR